MATEAVSAPLRALPNALTILRLALIPLFVALMLAGVRLTAALLTLCLLAVLAPCAFWFLKGRA